MATRKQRPKTPASNSPAELFNTLVAAFLEAWPANVRAAGQRLLRDQRMQPLWVSRRFGYAEFERAVIEYDHAIRRDPWAAKTQRERNAWLAKFEKTVNVLLRLMAQAPTTAEQWGFPVRDRALMHVAKRVGVEVPAPSAGADAFWRRMLQLEEVADSTGLTIADSIRHYRDQQRIDCTAKQALSKPRDKNASRAEFIVYFRESTGLSAQDVGIVAAVLFESSEIDGSLVRRLTRRRVKR